VAITYPDWEREPERRSDTEMTLNPHVAPMELDESFANGEAKTSTKMAARFRLTPGNEWLKDTAEVVRVNAGTRVDDLYKNILLTLNDMDLNLPTLGESGRVRQQI
jgi:hypothetical protein